MHLTNNDPKVHDSAVASKGVAGAPEEIEITAEMIEAGASALRCEIGDGGFYWDADALASAVFRAMALHRKSYNR
jgi:hypothetical protein